jgi:hypothetical protein
LIPQTGEILIAGGLDVTGNPLTSTVIITPSSVTAGPDLADARTEHTATLLNNGQILIAGGSSDAQGFSPLATTEIYDPTTQTFTQGPLLNAARMRHVAASFLNQTGEFVVLAGGAVATQGAQQVTLAGVATGEVIDVANGTATPLTQGLTQARYDAHMVRLDTGNFLVVGGEGAQGADLFNPTNATFTFVNAVTDRAGSAVISRGREVLVAGGQSATGLEDTSEVYDSATNTFAQGVRLTAARRDATATVVGSEIVLVGGRSAAGVATTVERVAGTSLGQATVAASQPLTDGRWAHSAVAIPNTQKVLVIGGFDASGLPMASIEELDLATATAPTTPTTGTGGLGGIGAPGGVGTTTPGVTAGAGGSGSTTGSTGSTTGSTGSTTGSTGSTSGSSGSSSSGGGISGFLNSIFGSGSSGNILSTIVQAALSALTNNQGGGFSGFMQAFVQNLMSGLLGSGSSGSSGGGLSGLLSGLLGGLLGGGSSSSGGSGGSGLSGVLSSLLGGLLGGGSSSGGSGGSSSGGSGLSGVLSGLLGGLFGGSGSQGSTASGGAGASGTAPGIVGMTPGQGRVGDSVLISAQNIASAVIVRFNGVQAPIQATNTNGSTTIITVTVPQGASTGAVTVETGGQTLPAGNFTVQ